MSDDYNLAVIYVAHEYPARTQTFVVDEFREILLETPLSRLYALHPGAGASAEFLLPRVSMIRVVFSALRSVRKILKILRSVFHDASSVRDVATQLFAIRHALSLADAVDAAFPNRSTRLVFHAHFLGRTLEVVHYATLLLEGKRLVVSSATGHAADVSSPKNRKRTSRLVGELDGVVAASKNVAKDLRSLAKRDPDEVVHCGVEIPASSRNRRADGGPLRVLTVGRLVPKKGIDDAIRAAAVLEASGHSFVWDVVGDGPMLDELVALRNSLLSAPSSIVFQGHLAHADILRRMEDSDAFVLPAKEDPSGDVDGIPVVLMEAMARSVPVVCTEVGGISELADSSVALIVGVGAHYEIASALRWISDSSESARQLAQRGREVVAGKFNRESEANKLLSYFRKLAEAG